MKKIILLVSLVAILISIAVAGPVDPNNETASVPPTVAEKLV